jgi:eukaryotic-like serine/threonine-protein kinase
VSLETGQKLGRYRIERLIAQGGMAEVYRADQELAAGIFRPAALKVIRVEYSESPDFREMFLDEARVACTLSHANIVHIYEVGEADGRLFMAMELVTGETLATIARTLRERDQRLSDEALFAVGISTCSALAAVHALKTEDGHVNLVHRDVSPHNLLLASDGTLKLIDFGIAKAVTNRNLTNPGVTKGKAGYFSPEQAMGKALDGRSDLFSLGVTLYKLASGKTPFDQHKTHHERNSALVRGQWTKLEEVTPGLPRGIYDVVGKAMALKPADRYGDAREMREALEKAAFAAGIPIRQDALFGYVSSDGEVSGSRPSASTRVKADPRGGPVPELETSRMDAPPRASGGGPRRMTERVAAAPRHTSVSGKQARRVNRAKFIGVFAVAVVVGSLGTLLLTRGGEPEKPAKLTRPVVPAEPPKPAPPTVVDEPVIEPDPVVTVVETPPPANPTPTPVAPPKPKPVKPKPAVVAVVPAPPAPPKVEDPEPPAIPQGVGKLVVSIGGSDPAEVLLNGRKVGPAPQQLRELKSGRYTVELALTNGKRTRAWTGAVMPEVTTRLKYDPVSKEWELNGR